MANYYVPQPPYGAAPAPQNLQFYQTSYAPAVPGHATPAQAAGYGFPAGGRGSAGLGGTRTPNFGAAPGVSGRMGEQRGLRTGWLAAFSTEGYDGEPPLLEELGVNFAHIQAKTLAVLNPFRRIDQHLMDDSDLAGPVLFCFLFGTILLFSGKVHFGYIYGFAVLGSVALHFVLSLMTPDNAGAGGADASPHPHPHYGAPIAQPGAGGIGSASTAPAASHISSTLTMARSTSVLGYCLLPLVATSLLGIALPMDTPLGIALTSAAILWCTYSASGIFCTVGRMRAMRGLVAYPLALFYVCFGIMGIFSSRGSGAAAAARY